MKYLSLFSGIGSENVAWKHLDWSCVAHSENNKNACKVLNFHYPNIPNLGDIKKIDWQKDINENVDLVIGGSPCQSFSPLGNKKELEDENGKLALEYSKAIEEINPRFFIWENVKNVLYQKDNGFGCLLSSLLGEDEIISPIQKNWKNSGFLIGKQSAIAYRVFDSQYFGVPQRRNRIFLLGLNFRKCGTLDEIKWENFPGLPAAILFEGINNKKNTRETKRKHKKNNEQYIINSNSIGIDNSIYTQVFPTIARKAPYIYKDNLFRKLTPIEVERLQGFPDNYTFANGLSNNKRYNLLGNAITTNVLRFLGNQIDSAIKDIIY